MINNLDIIKNNVAFSNEYCYILKMCLRKKEISWLNNYNISEYVLSTRAVKNFDGLKDFVDSLIPICNKLEGRLYLNLSPIYYKSFAEDLKNNANILSDICLYDLYGTNNSQDSNSPDISLLDIDEPQLPIFNGILKYINEKKYSDIFYGPTISGYHIVGKTDELTDIAKQFKMAIPPHTQAQFLIYSPLERKATV